MDIPEHQPKKPGGEKSPPGLWFAQALESARLNGRLLLTELAAGAVKAQH